MFNKEKTNTDIQDVIETYGDEGIREGILFEYNKIIHSSHLHIFLFLFFFCFLSLYPNIMLGKT